MTTSDQYRAKAAEFAALAQKAQTPELQREHAALAAAYRRLAEQADQNAMIKVSELPR